MKKSKNFCIFFAIGMLAAGFMPFGRVNTYAQTLDEADKCLVDFVAQDVGEDVTIQFTYTPLYNETLQADGRAYQFAAENVSGYALMKSFALGEEQVYEIEELCYGEVSPFASCEGLPVYLAQRTYLEYKNEAFYDIASQTVLSQTQVDNLAQKGFGYCGGANFEAVTETVTYATKTTDQYWITGQVPAYESIANTGCANTAGGIIIGYYDRFCENLIPDFQAYTIFGGGVFYKLSSEEIYTMMYDLYDYMGTDSVYYGTTFSGFQTGMENYVEDKGYTYSTQSMMSWGSFDFAKYKTAVEANKPVALFMSGYALLGGVLEEGEGVDSIISSYSNGTHVAVGFGYRQDKYYDTNGNLIDTRTYLNASTGLAMTGIHYLNMNGLGHIDQAVAIHIS